MSSEILDQGAPDSLDLGRKSDLGGGSRPFIHVLSEFFHAGSEKSDSKGKNPSQTLHSFHDFPKFPFERV
jgi:hypothetical protein